MKTALWRGSKEITESPESPQWDFQDEKIICTRTFYGPYATCLARKPANNQKMADLGADSDLLVVNVKIKKQKGGKGEMVVTLEETIETTSAEVIQPPKYEIEWVQAERKLESHPRYASPTGEGAVGEKELTVTDYVQLKKWEDEPNAILRADFKFIDSGITKTLSENAQDFARKKIKGQEAYNIWVPVLRRTRIWTGPHKATKCGIRLTESDLPSALQALAPDGYVWMKTADRGNQSGRFSKHERQEEWTGFDLIDADIYK